MEMAGCEAGGTLFAISRVVARDSAQVATLLRALRQASLAQIDNAVLHPVANSGDALTSNDVLVDGQGPNGAAVQARLKWLQSGLEVYQIAAYAAHLQTAETESLIAEARPIPEVPLISATLPVKSFIAALLLPICPVREIIRSE